MILLVVPMKRLVIASQVKCYSSVFLADIKALNKSRPKYCVIII